MILEFGFTWSFVDKELPVPTTLSVRIATLKNNDDKNSVSETRHRIFEIVSSMAETDIQRLLKGLEKWQQSKLRDKREHYREPTSIYAFFEGDGLSFRDFIKNLSTGGLYIETGIPLSATKELFISFLHPDTKTLIKVKGRIVRADSKGIGVEFDKPRTDI